MEDSPNPGFKRYYQATKGKSLVALMRIKEYGAQGRESEETAKHTHC